MPVYINTYLKSLKLSMFIRIMLNLHKNLTEIMLMIWMDCRTVSLMLSFTKGTVYFMLSFHYTLKLWSVDSNRYIFGIFIGSYSPQTFIPLCCCVQEMCLKSLTMLPRLKKLTLEQFLRHNIIWLWILHWCF